MPLLIFNWFDIQHVQYLSACGIVLKDDKNQMSTCFDHIRCSESSRDNQLKDQPGSYKGS